MWPRISELLFGLWLAASPFIFETSEPMSFTSLNSVVCGVIVIAASCLSFLESTRHARVATAVVGLWLLGAAYATASRPAEPELQSQFTVGLLLVLFVISPNEANRPPRPWRKFVSSDRAGS